MMNGPHTEPPTKHVPTPKCAGAGGADRDRPSNSSDIAPFGKTLTLYRRCDEGAVTVDWVVLVAVTIGFAIAMAAAMQDETMSLVDLLNSYMSKWTFE